MSERLFKYGITSYVSEDTLVVPFQTDFYVEVLEALREEILQQLYEKPQLKGLIIDVSQVNLLDLNDMAVLEETMRMASIYRVSSFLVGIRPMAALALIHLGYEKKIQTALTIDQALNTMRLLQSEADANQEEGLDEVLDDSIDEPIEAQEDVCEDTLLERAESVVFEVAPDE